MKFYNSEKEMPLCEIEKGDGTVHHLNCNGSRRHVLTYDTHGEHCSEPRCELNNRKPKVNIAVIGPTGVGKMTLTEALMKQINEYKEVSHLRQEKAAAGNIK